MTKMSSLNYMELCRLCLVKEKVSVPIFEGEGGERQIFDKIATCLPVKVSQDDKLPKKICSDCVYRVENSYQFWNTTSNSEKQLLEWVVNDVKVDSKNLVSDNITMETEQLVLKEEAIDHDQTAADVAKSLSRVEAVLTEEAGQPGGVSEEEEEEEDSDDGGGGGGGEDSNSEESGEEPPGKEEIESEEEEEEEEPYEELEPTTFVNVSLACDEAGPSGIQQTRQQTKQDSQTSAASASATTANAEAPSTSAADPAASGEQNTCGLTFSRNSPLGSDGETIVPLEWQARIISQNNTLNNNKTDGGDLALPSDLLQKNKCQLCRQTFLLESELTAHILDHAKDPEMSPGYPCPTCGQVFPKRFLMKRHLRRHDDVWQYKCDICSKFYKSKYSLDAHMKWSHSGETKNHSCSVCGYKAYHLSAIRQHEKIHTGVFDYTCGDCGRGFHTKTMLKSHRITAHDDEPFKCNYCGKIYRSKANRDEHVKIHDPDYVHVHQCELCGKTFHTKPELKKHLARHRGDEKYVCEECGKPFKSKTTLVNHTRIHSGDKPYVCMLCGKAFTTSFFLKTHIRIHTGEKPFSCEICSKSFSQKSSLTVHTRYHTGLRPYLCSVCNLGFVTRTLLNTHIKRHVSQNCT